MVCLHAQLWCSGWSQVLNSWRLHNYQPQHVMSTSSMRSLTSTCNRGFQHGAWALSEHAQYQNSEAEAAKWNTAINTWTQNLFCTQQEPHTHRKCHEPGKLLHNECVCHGFTHHWYFRPSFPGMENPVQKILPAFQWTVVFQLWATLTATNTVTEVQTQLHDDKHQHTHTGSLVTVTHSAALASEQWVTVLLPTYERMSRVLKAKQKPFVQF